MTLSCRTLRLNRNSATVQEVEDSMRVVASLHFNAPLIGDRRREV
jgi:hypothetical protein